MSDLLFQPGPDSDPDPDLLLLASRSGSNERTSSPRLEEVPGRSRTALAAGSRREDSGALSLTAPPSGPDDVDSGSASGDLLPDDVYRIANGREVRDTPWTRLVDRTRSALAGPRAKQEEQLDHALEELR